MTIETDVLICGSGSAGLCAAVWLVRLGINFKVLEKRDGPLKIGQADGIQCRTVEVFESFDLDGELTKTAYWVNEVCFWSVDKSSGDCIVRSGRTADVMPGISWKPHVIMNQAHLNGLLVEDMKKHCGQDVEYAVTVKDVIVDDNAAEDPNALAITVTAEKDGKELSYRAKYVLVSKFMPFTAGLLIYRIRVVMVRIALFEDLLDTKWLEIRVMRSGFVSLFLNTFKLNGRILTPF
jgi:phenol 2-monooxygenase (NADPH)